MFKLNCYYFTFSGFFCSVSCNCVVENCTDTFGRVRITDKILQGPAGYGQNPPRARGRERATDSCCALRPVADKKIWIFSMKYMVENVKPAGARGLRTKSSKWPWARAGYGQMLRTAAGYGQKNMPVQFSTEC